MTRKNIGAYIAFSFAVLLSIGCSGDGTFESPNSFEVTTPEAIHGQTGYRADVMVAKEGEEITQQVVLVLQDSDASTAPIYVVMGYTSGAPHSTNENAIAVVELIDSLHAAIAVAQVASLPKGTKQKGGILYGGNDLFVCYLRVTMPSETLYWSVWVSQERRGKIFEFLAKPPKVIDTLPATVTEISYYSDNELTIPLVNEVFVGDTVYTKVVFSKDVPIVFADDALARPFIGLSDVVWESFQFRMKPPDIADEHLQSGDAKPYQNTKNTFICKYVVRGRDFSAIFRTHVNHPAVSGNTLRVEFFSYNDEMLAQVGETTAETITTWHPDDCVGQVYQLVQGGGRLRPSLIAGTAVTIASGPRAGEHTVTDINGRYLFPSVAGDTLHLRVERMYLEPKEVIVHRSRPTALANGAVPNYAGSGDVQWEPGNILMGHAWPDVVRPILEETLLPYDLLYLSLEGSEAEGYTSGAYAVGIIIVTSYIHLDFFDPFEVFWTFAHEIGHAHQVAVASVDGSDPDSPDTWRNSPEGRAFSEALRRDLAIDHSSYDNAPYYRDSLTENAAHTFGWYWHERLGGRTTRHPGETMKDIAPNRYEWIEEWMLKQ